MTKLRVALAVCCLAALFGAPAAAHDAASQPTSNSASAQQTAPEPAPQPQTAPAEDAAPEPAPKAALLPAGTAAAEMKSPRVTSLPVDWAATRAEVTNLGQGGDATEAFAALNAANGAIFPNVAASGVPVLLPFDTASFLRDRAQGNAGDTGKYFSDFHAPTFFYPGPSGYDAAFRAQPNAEVQLSASSVIYELDGPAVDQGTPVPELEHDFPGIRRVLLESRLRYIFTRFGVLYFVSILCSDGPRHARHVACREADQIAARFIKALYIVGGAPAPEPSMPEVQTVSRPEAVSPDFTYDAPGDLLPGTAMHAPNGRADTIVYAGIRFPMEHPPAFINSQSFMNWGNCDLTGLIRLGGRGKEAAYRCRVNDLRLFNDESKNYAYPWRDNFCEHRHYIVSQCPAGLGHQGEDIRPRTCTLRNQGADRCQPYQEQVVAVRDGMIWRNAGDEALYLTTDAPGEHIRFRYLHMNPHMLDAAGMISGRALTQGDVVGAVGDYGAREGGTSYHLHFNMQVPTRAGWLFVNPYMTLVASYERLIGARGQVISPGVPAADTSATSNPASADAMVPAKPAGKSETGSDHRASERATIEHCAARFVKGHRRRICWTAAAEIGGRPRPAHAVRAVDRRLPLKGDRARHRTGDLRPRHERG